MGTRDRSLAMHVHKNYGDVMITIDGSMGEGGGQILRSALALSMLTQQPFRIDNIRAGRSKPGLMRQHLTAVYAARTLCHADTEGETIGSTTLTFKPKKVTPGKYAFAIGSAGSTTLVLQAILPALLTADAETEITLEGGTHNPFAPPIDFLRRAYIPQIERMGPRVSIELARAGFFPSGGGRFVVRISPTPRLSPIDLLDRGVINAKRAVAVLSALPRDIGERELKRVTKRLTFESSELDVVSLPADQGPGNLLMLQYDCQHCSEVFVGFGMKGVTAEAVADFAIDHARQWLASSGAVGPFLADQLLLPMALSGGGSLTTTEVTEHTRTNAQVIAMFLPLQIHIDEHAATPRISIESR